MHMASDDRRSGISSIINKMADNGISLYEISDPRKSYAGHTVYRVSAKVCQEGFPGEIEEVVVWRRFSEFKKLQKDLSRLYNSNSGETDFPCLPKATFFDRFDEVVIEERRRGALNLLNFAGNIPRLAKSQYFQNFFEGGIYQRAACSRNSSRTSSLSSSDGDIPECHDIDKEDECATTQDTDEFQGCLELGGVWLCKQPSLVEGLDKTETAVDETIYEQSTDGECQLSVENPSLIRSLFDEDNEDVFGKEKVKNDKEMSWDSDGEDDYRSRKTSTWLQRAISLCSEGDDIETLACEAENDEYVKELDFPKPFAELEKNEVKSQEENERSKYECNERNAESDCVENSVFNLHQMVDTKKAIGIESKRETVTRDQNKIQSECRENQRSKDESCEAYNLPKSISKHKDLGDSSISLKESQKKTKPYTFDPQDSNLLTDSTKDDYLFAAAKIVRQALNFELDGHYKEAFHLYKKCVSLLLSGVQGEKDAKRRDAVRRKTAQYLLKAEALYTAYVHESKELPENTSSRLNAIGEDSNHYPEVPSQLQLPNYSVIGVVGKVILVKNTGNKNTYIIKVLPKTESSYHSCHKSKDFKRRKSLLKAAYAQSPFIVKLHQHSETPTAVLLLLEHARGGRLCDYLTPLKRLQQQQSSVTSKSQRFVQNLKQTEVNKGIPKACVSRNDKRENQKTKSLVTGSRKEKEDSSGKYYPDTEPSAIHCQNKDDLKLRQENDRLSLDKNHGGSIAGSAKITPTFALLDDYFSWSSKTSIESYVRVWMAEIILALAHLHSNDIICRDLNPRNILISDEGHVLLTHFSVWEDVNEELDLFSLEEAYCAPELFKLEKVTPAADWWSVGALFYEILTGQALTKSYPWGIRSHTEIETANNLSAEASALIRELIKISPSERLGSGVNGLEDIKSHPFFSGVDWSALKSRHCQS